MRRALIIILFLFSKAYAQPSFKGGPNALNAFLTQHIIYPEYSRTNCIPGTIQVSFQVDKSGTVSNVKVHQGLGIDLDDEAVRVVKLTTGKWIVPPDYQGATTMILPVRFQPDYSKCVGLSGQTPDADKAIAAYQVRQELENAVTNYYENKYAGKADPSKEADIIALKKRLGFDDELIDQLLDQASAKLKQGDTEGACHDWKFIRNIGSNRADAFLAKHCK